MEAGIFFSWLQCLTQHPVTLDPEFLSEEQLHIFHLQLLTGL